MLKKTTILVFALIISTRVLTPQVRFCRADTKLTAPSAGTPTVDSDTVTLACGELAINSNLTFSDNAAVRRRSSVIRTCDIGAFEYQSGTVQFSAAGMIFPIRP
jgi:hypothetical protein